ncbi:uncharacterized protein LOC119023096 isoform X2 [Acanthopagrus latus]|uniref:uncharacterized protein LOC119023096 isoform X2 n=1 Tax=Acanthopagrus latus TaxID=8177 RepID=UPI00187BC745|nr:uncharacterized protein LOC119023096 isoform X2 [Acanthopagrus latus]
MRHFREPHERSGCYLAAVLDKWQGLKILVSQNFKDKSYSGLWETMLTKEPYREDYKNILELVQLMLVLPISAAQCERGFSAQNRIKSSKRSSHAVSTTKDLMRITLEGPRFEDYDPNPAVDCWINSAKRARRGQVWRTCSKQQSPDEQLLSSPPVRMMNQLRRRGGALSCWGPSLTQTKMQWSLESCSATVQSQASVLITVHCNSGMLTQEPMKSKCLASPATAVPCERLFILADHKVQKKRAATG